MEEPKGELKRILERVGPFGHAEVVHEGQLYLIAAVAKNAPYTYGLKKEPRAQVHTKPAPPVGETRQSAPDSPPPAEAAAEFESFADLYATYRTLSRRYEELKKQYDAVPAPSLPGVVTDALERAGGTLEQSRRLLLRIVDGRQLTQTEAAICASTVAETEAQARAALQALRSQGDAAYRRLVETEGGGTPEDEGDEGGGNLRATAEYLEIHYPGEKTGIVASAYLAVLARVKALQSEHENDLGAVIDERDGWERWATEVAQLLGCEEEWSSSHDHRLCAFDAIRALQRERDELKAEREEVCSVTGYKDGDQGLYRYPDVGELPGLLEEMARDWLHAQEWEEKAGELERERDEARERVKELEDRRDLAFWKKADQRTEDIYALIDAAVARRLHLDRLDEGPGTLVMSDEERAVYDRTKPFLPAPQPSRVELQRKVNAIVRDIVAERPWSPDELAKAYWAVEDA